MRVTSLGQALSTQPCCFCRCQCRPALDPDIKRLRESFPPFMAWVCVLSFLDLHPGSDLCNQLTSNVKKLYTASVFKSTWEPLFRTTDNPIIPSLPVIYVSSFLGLLERIGSQFFRSFLKQYPNEYRNRFCWLWSFLLLVLTIGRSSPNVLTV